MLAGFVILVIGVLYVLDVLIPTFTINFNIVWPVLLIVISIYFIIKNKKLDISSFVIFFIGTWWLLVNTNLIKGLLLDLFWPIMLIVVGLSIIISTITFTKKIKKNKMLRKNGENILNYHGIFGGASDVVSDDDFKGANIYSIFGGCEIDFTNVKVNSDSVIINVYSIFGGSDLKLPDDYNISFSSTAIFGENENQKKVKYDKNKKTIYINCFSIFGGSEIK